MGKINISISVALVMILLSGCCSFLPTQLVSGAENVELIGNSMPQGNCKKLGEVEGFANSDCGGIPLKDASLKDIKTSAINDLKNNAFALGGDTVSIIASDGGFRNAGGSMINTGFGFGYVASDSTGEYHIQGVAYKCK